MKTRKRQSTVASELQQDFDSIMYQLEKIQRELGWRPQETFDTGIRKTVEWYLANRIWWERIRSGVYSGERLGVVV